MKKIIILNVILFTYSYAGKAQDKKYTTDDFCKIKWYIKSINFNEQDIKYTDAQKEDNWMIFHKDGKHEVTNNGKTTEAATWEYDKKESMLTFKDNGDETKQKIIKLTATELILQGDLEGKVLTFYLEK